MLRFKLALGDVIGSPKARAIFILISLLLATVVGGAPTDHTGG
jgi:hypothetical protein